MAAMTHPAVDVFTGQAAVVLQMRPVVSLSAWMVDALVTATRAGKALQVVTPASSRLTFPLAETIRILGGRWVVQEADTYYDGFRGDRLAWDGAQFAPVTRKALPLGAVSGGTIRLDITVLHPASEDLWLGRLVELCMISLTGRPPLGWGVAEPAACPWSLRELTAYCRARSPEPSTLLVVGEGTVGLLRVSRRPSGVAEKLTLVVASPGPDSDAVDRLAADLAGAAVANVRTMFAVLHPGRTDTTEEPRFTGRPVPYGILIGPEAVAECGAAHALAAPAPHVLLTGPATRPLAWCHLNGDPQTLADVLAHFGVPKA